MFVTECAAFTQFSETELMSLILSLKWDEKLMRSVSPMPKKKKKRAADGALRVYAVEVL